MTATVEEPTQQFEIVQHETGDGTGYVIYIVDIWEGDKRDPTTEIVRMIGVWDPESLTREDGSSFDPDFRQAESGSYRYRRRRSDLNKEDFPKPMHWDTLLTVKQADRDAEKFQRQVDSMIYAEGAYYYGSQRATVELFTRFQDAIETVAQDPDNEEAWEAIEAWRMHAATANDK